MAGLLKWKKKYERRKEAFERKSSVTKNKFSQFFLELIDTVRVQVSLVMYKRCDLSFVANYLTVVSR